MPVLEGWNKEGELEEGTNRGLTPSDQLFAIFVVNIILVGWVWLSFTEFYNSDPPNLANWIYWAEGITVIGAGAMSLLDSWWPRLRRIADDGASSTAPLNVNVNLLKGAVFAFTILDIVVLWRLSEETGGVLSPYAPFLPAPAIFASFVTKKWQTILGLSLLVAVAIGLSTLKVPSPLPDLHSYQGSAAVMVILAGLLSALRAWVAGTGEPFIGQNVGGPVKTDVDVEEIDDDDSSDVDGLQPDG